MVLNNLEDIKIAPPVKCRSFINKRCFIKYGINSKEIVNAFNTKDFQDGFYKFAVKSLLGFNSEAFEYKNKRFYIGLDPRYELTLCLEAEIPKDFNPLEIFKNKEDAIPILFPFASPSRWHYEENNLPLEIYHQPGKLNQKLIAKKSKLLELIRSLPEENICSPEDLSNKINNAPFTACIENKYSGVSGMIKLDFKKTENHISLLVYLLYRAIQGNKFKHLGKEYLDLSRFLNAYTPFKYNINPNSQLFAAFYKSEEFPIADLEKDKHAYKSFYQRIDLAWNLFEAFFSFCSQGNAGNLNIEELSTHGISPKISTREFFNILEILDTMEMPYFR